MRTRTVDATLSTGKNMIANHHRDTPIIHLAGGLMLLAASAIACANAPEGAQAVVEETVDKIMVSLRTDREAILKDPVRVRALVDETLVPRVDFDRVARLTLGKKHWKGASSEQRGQFTHEFREYLVRFYSTALAEYAKDNDVPEDVIKLLPLGPQESDRFTLIRSHVGQPSGDPISVDYRMYFTEGEWKVIDVSVGGVSMVKNYRSNFESEIRQSGLDGLIRKLATRNREFASN